MMESRSILKLALSSILLTGAAFAAEGTFQRTVTVPADVTVDVGTGSGYIHITPGNDGQASITGHVRSGGGWMMWSNSSGEDRVKHYVDNPPIEQTGNILRIGKRREDEQYRNVSIDYDITLPRGARLSAGSGSGDLQISGMNNVSALGTGSGDIRIDGSTVNGKIETGSGQIRGQHIGGSVRLSTGSGDINVDQSSLTDVKAETGSGNIRVSNVSGTLRAGTGSGDVEIGGSPTSDWKVTTGSGNVHLNVGSGAKFSLEAESSSGEIKVDIPITMRGSLSRHHVSGVVNGGGAAIRAETGSGDINIR